MTARVQPDRHRARHRVVVEVHQVIGQAGLGATKFGHLVVPAVGLALVGEQRTQRPGGSKPRRFGGAQVRLQRRRQRHQGELGRGGRYDLGCPSGALHVPVPLRPPGGSPAAGGWIHPPIITTGTRAKAELAGPGLVLELGIGTGRVALPLRQRGLEVHGIDASPAMLAKLRAKPGGDRARAIVGDMAEVGVDASYSLVFAVFNTLFALVSQDQQVRCFANVAGRLAEGRVFVVEAFVPDPGGAQAVKALRVTVDSVLLAISSEDPVAQRIDAQQVLLGPHGVRLVPGVLRYARPAELDLMARLAGLRLRERWGGWRGPVSATAAQPGSCMRSPSTTWWISRCACTNHGRSARQAHPSTSRQCSSW